MDLGTHKESEPTRSVRQMLEIILQLQKEPDNCKDELVAARDSLQTSQALKVKRQYLVICPTGS